MRFIDLIKTFMTVCLFLLATHSNVHSAAAASVQEPEDKTIIPDGKEGFWRVCTSSPLYSSGPGKEKKVEGLHGIVSYCKQHSYDEKCTSQCKECFAELTSDICDISQNRLSQVRAWGPHYQKETGKIIFKSNDQSWANAFMDVYKRGYELKKMELVKVNKLPILFKKDHVVRYSAMYHLPELRGPHNKVQATLFCNRPADKEPRYSGHSFNPRYNTLTYHVHKRNTEDLFKEAEALFERQEALEIEEGQRKLSLLEKKAYEKKIENIDKSDSASNTFSDEYSTMIIRAPDSPVSRF